MKPSLGALRAEAARTRNKVEALPPPAGDILKKTIDIASFVPYNRIVLDNVI